MLPHEKYTRPRILTGPGAVDLIVNGPGAVDLIVIEVFVFQLG